MQSKSLGKLSGKLLIFGGVYSNYQALVAMKSAADLHNINPNNVICTGDIIAYCAQPVACLELIQKWGNHCIRGNVELNLINKADDCGCNFNEGSRCDIFSKRWYPYSRNKLGQKHLEFLEKIPDRLHFTYSDRNITVIHGGWENVSEYIFKSTEWKQKEHILSKADSDVIICGHSGIPFIDIHEEKYWLNAGVIGMPANDGNQNTWYAILDDKNNKLEISFHQLEYDFSAASYAIEKNDLIESYAKTLKNGIWDNCEILPELETAQQGKALEFDEKIVG